MSMVRRILGMSVARGYGVMLSLATLFVSARILGPTGRGEFAAAMAWAALFATLSNLSLGQALQHRLQSSEKKMDLGEQLGTLGGLTVLLSVVALGSAAALYWYTGGSLFKGLDGTLLLLAMASVPLLTWEQFASNILAAAARTELLNRAQYGGRTAGFLIFFLLVVYWRFGVNGALASQLLGQLLVALMVGWPLWKLAGRSVRWAQREVTPLLRSGTLIHLTTVSAFLLDQVSILLINNYLGKQDVGYYQLAQQMVGLLLIVPQSALMVIYGGLAGSNPDQFWPTQRSVAKKVLAALAVVALLAYLLAPFAIGLVAGPAFAPSAKMFQALLPTVLGISLALLMTPQWISRGMLKMNTILTIVVSGVVVLSSSWVIPRYGVDGAIGVRLAVYAVWVPLAQMLFWWWCNKRADAAHLNAMSKGVEE
ncbi:lipopolysaccharide biosynthesis protein [Rugamonas aquatica]|uniref:Oligosaccharide flippase family protein n=1 Tax=Rugamonas aquatica TaxID=2743357 RepID=A0A6A7MZ21_9BURK|nr:lipopolysaccharide biosynthesis protein [Rugamonas aquatica]MQA38009.1 oligosaccharide flippase family protein [Rugamonas aquatica]